ncbi:MAG: XisH family protein [Blastocatellia bacterium]
MNLVEAFEDGYTEDMAKDAIHESVKNALVRDGWQITADPYQIKTGDFSIYADLAADRAVAAEKAGRRIVVEIKSFTGRSPVSDLYVAIGQYDVYYRLLKLTAPERKLYLAIADLVWNDFFQLETVQYIVRDSGLSILIVNTQTEEVVQWIN